MFVHEHERLRYLHAAAVAAELDNYSVLRGSAHQPPTANCRGDAEVHFHPFPSIFFISFSFLSLGIELNE